jgi:hypothetical protein
MHISSSSAVETIRLERSAWFMSRSCPTARRSPSTKASSALRTRVAIASKVFSVRSGARASWRATSSTISLVDAPSPLSPITKRKGALGITRRKRGSPCRGIPQVHREASCERHRRVHAGRVAVKHPLPDEREFLGGGLIARGPLERVDGAQHGDPERGRAPEARAARERDLCAHLDAVASHRREKRIEGPGQRQRVGPRHRHAPGRDRETRFFRRDRHGGGAAIDRRSEGRTPMHHGVLAEQDDLAATFAFAACLGGNHRGREHAQ